MLLNLHIKCLVVIKKPQANGDDLICTLNHVAVLSWLYIWCSKNLNYFSDDVREQGFTVVIDMRGSSTWNSVKPILKVLQEFFANAIHSAHIIKPDNFWQKQRTSLGSQKYKFETNLISLDALLKIIDPTQLTSDMDGTMLYDHNTWIELRCVSFFSTICAPYTEVTATNYFYPGLGRLFVAKLRHAGPFGRS